MKQFIYFVTFCFLTINLTAQTTNDAQPMRVYLDNFSPPTPTNDLKSEFPAVLYVAKPSDADVSVLSLYEQIGNNYWRYGLCFWGHGALEGQKDTIWTLFYTLMPELEIRNKKVAVFQQGLAPFMYRLGLLSEPPPAVQKVEDQWHRTTFQLSGSGSLSGNNVRSEVTTGNDPTIKSQKNDTRIDINSYLSVWHFAEKWRHSGNISIQSVVDYQSTDTSDRKRTPYSHSYGMGTFSAREITDHFSIGLGGGVVSGKNEQVEYQNINAALTFEYNLFSYKNYFQHRLLFNYSVSHHPHLKILQSPVKTKWSHTLRARYFERKRWGYYSALAQTSMRFGFDSYNAFDLYLSANVGFHVGHNVFLTLNGDYSLQNDQSAAIFGLSPSLYSKHARANNLQMQVGLTHLFGSGVRNNQNPAIIYNAYTQSIFSDNRIQQDGWNSWAFSAAGSGKISHIGNRDNLPNLGKKQSSRTNFDFTPAFEVWRVGRRFRNTSFVEIELEGFRYKEDNQVKSKNTLAFNWRIYQDAVFTFKDRIGLGAKLIGENQENSFNQSGGNNINLLAGIEYNMIPYRHFFRKNWTIGFYHTLYSQQYQQFGGGRTRNYSQLSSQSFVWKPWGFWRSNLSCNFSSFENTFFQNYAATNISWNAGGEIGWNLNQNFYFTLSPNVMANRSKQKYSSSFPNMDVKSNNSNINYNLQAGVTWCFGRGQTNVNNPRLLF